MKRKFYLLGLWAATVVLLVSCDSPAFIEFHDALHDLADTVDPPEDTEDTEDTEETHIYPNTPEQSAIYSSIFRHQRNTEDTENTEDSTVSPALRAAWPGFFRTRKYH